jgi:hypothetical protein
MCLITLYFEAAHHCRTYGFRTIRVLLLALRRFRQQIISRDPTQVSVVVATLYMQSYCVMIQYMLLSKACSAFCPTSHNPHWDLFPTGLAVLQDVLLLAGHLVSDLNTSTWDGSYFTFLNTL